MICFDTETTGLTDEDEIIQLTFIDSDDPNACYNNFFAPLNRTSFPEASAVTGLYYDQPVPSDPEGRCLCEFPPIGDPEAFDEVQSWLDSSYALMGYHVAYDVRMMENAGFDMASHVYYDPMYAFATYYWATHPDEEYTTKAGKVRSPWLDWKNQYVNRNLSFAANYFGITFGAHDSAEDVRATIALYHELMIVERTLFVPDNIAYDRETGEPYLDANGEECFAAADGKPLIYPNGYRIESLFPQGGYDLETLKEIDS